MLFRSVSARGGKKIAFVRDFPLCPVYFPLSSPPGFTFHSLSCVPLISFCVAFGSRLFPIISTPFSHMSQVQFLLLFLATCLLFFACLRLVFPRASNCALGTSMVICSRRFCRTLSSTRVSVIDLETWVGCRKPWPLGVATHGHET